MVTTLAHLVASRSRVPHANIVPLQAASAIENLKMETPVKKLNFSQTDKENKPFDADLASLEAEMDAKHTEKTILKPTEAPQPPKEAQKAVVDLNADEPLLRENPNRFVMFPIQYHEVCDAPDTIPRVKWPTY
jgi:ribonucleoside-diphosphate reductase subunit M2